MKRLALAACAALLFAAPVNAGETEVAYIDSIVEQATIARYTAPDQAAYDAAKVKLAATAIDPEVSPPCRLYADLAVTMFEVVELWAERPDSAILRWFGDTLANASGQVRNDCLLAI